MHDHTFYYVPLITDNEYINLIENVFLTLLVVIVCLKLGLHGHSPAISKEPFIFIFKFVLIVEII